MAELINITINKKSIKFQECSSQSCFFLKDEGSKDSTLQGRKCPFAVHHQCSRLSGYQMAGLPIPKLYKSITTSSQRAGTIKKRHDRNQEQPKETTTTTTRSTQESSTMETLSTNGNIETNSCQLTGIDGSKHLRHSPPSLKINFSKQRVFAEGCSGVGHFTLKTYPTTYTQ